MKASLLINLPSLFRKWEGLNMCGLSHSLSSYRTEVSSGNTTVPCMQKKRTGLSIVSEPKDCFMSFWKWMSISSKDNFMLESSKTALNNWPLWWSNPGRWRLGWLCEEVTWGQCWRVSVSHEWRHQCTAGFFGHLLGSGGFQPPCSTRPGPGLETQTKNVLCLHFSVHKPTCILWVHEKQTYSFVLLFVKYFRPLTGENINAHLWGKIQTLCLCPYPVFVDIWP